MPQKRRPDQLGIANRSIHRRALRIACTHGYQRLLQRSLLYTPVTAVFVLVIMCSIVFLYRSAKSELAPHEDQASC